MPAQEFEAPKASRGIAVVVDDDASVLKLLKDLLLSAGFEVEPFNDFQVAKERLKSGRTDVLITDVRLGAFNGLQLVVRAKATSPDVVAVVLTGFDDHVLHQEAVGVGAHFLLKPIRVEQLLQLLSAAHPAG
jgi:FixJ family two-component response regulator